MVDLGQAELLAEIVVPHVVFVVALVNYGENHRNHDDGEEHHTAGDFVGTRALRHQVHRVLPVQNEIRQRKLKKHA